MNLPPGDPRHGLNGYHNLGCRCDVCREANRVYQQQYRRRVAGLLVPGDPRHGTAHGYTNLGCRCETCRLAHTARRRAPMTAR